MIPVLRKRNFAVRNMRVSAHTYCSQLLSCLGCVILGTAVAGCGLHLSSAQGSFGTVLWKGHLSPSGNLSTEDMHTLSMLTNGISRVTLSDVFFIWSHMRNRLPSVNPVCISRTKSYFVVSGGDEPSGNIENAGLLLIRHTDGWVWDQVGKKWKSIGFTALRKEEVDQQIKTGSDINDVLKVLGVPFERLPSDDKRIFSLLYHAHGGRLYIVSVNLGTKKVIDVRDEMFGKR